MLVLARPPLGEVGGGGERRRARCTGGGDPQRGGTGGGVGVGGWAKQAPICCGLRAGPLARCWRAGRRRRRWSLARL